MDTNVVVALITTSASILLAALSVYFTKRAERAADLRTRKQEQYLQLLKAFAAFYDTTGNEITARQNLASALNTIVLVAPQDLFAAAMAYYREMLIADPPRFEVRDELMKVLILKMRDSLELPFKDHLDSFDFTIIPVDARTDPPKSKAGHHSRATQS